MKKIILASNNSGKIRELQNAFSQFQIIPQSELNVSEIPETGFTFVENALLKARHACEITGLPAISDDSGLEVAALHGKPGIYSARFAGTDANAQKNIQKLLADLEGVPDEKRKARFYCVLVFLAHADDSTPLICEGTWNGTILTHPIGKNGFGYDPVFFDANENCSAAQLSLQKKRILSHRGKALELLIEKLPEKLL